MNSYPLPCLSLQQAMQKQFDLVETITQHFKNNEIFNVGDVGLHPQNNAPIATGKVESVLKDFFHGESCILVRGAGSGALRFALLSMLGNGDSILLHNAPIYPTTQTNIEAMGLKQVFCDFNNPADVAETIKNNKINAVLVQISRQQLADNYNAADVIAMCKEAGIPCITDDNYTVMKAEKIGNELGADLATFSMFKLLGHQGIGCIVGSHKYIEKIRKMNYSGGSAVQGFEAMECLRGLVYAPVALAIQANVLTEVKQILDGGEIPVVDSCSIVNAQSRVLLVQLKQPIAKKIIEVAKDFGAATYPVGAESKFEIAPLFYRCSSTLLRANPEYADSLIRINPMRAGAATVIKILKQSIEVSR
ncbi:MAG: aminotransferase class V-fold PLP-dependent enzyme [Alphaproteobacteria bacterium]|jgi:selenocysteine lyase/cysteine desulfurase|nr:aminotransferase class V-fold PLP-dependent enzyme [Alphaproteobacteria bacterium]